MWTAIGEKYSMMAPSFRVVGGSRPRVTARSATFRQSPPQHLRESSQETGSICKTSFHWTMGIFFSLPKGANESLPNDFIFFILAFMCAF